MNTAGRRRPLFFFHSFVNIYSEGIKAKLLNFRPERGIHINVYTNKNCDIYMHLVYRRLMKCFIYILAVSLE